MANADFDQRKRVLFFQHLSPSTTRTSLKDYLLAYKIERRTVPPIKAGKPAPAPHGQGECRVGFFR